MFCANLLRLRPEIAALFGGTYRMQSISIFGDLHRALGGDNAEMAICEQNMSSTMTPSVDNRLETVADEMRLCLHADEPKIPQIPIEMGTFYYATKSP